MSDIIVFENNNNAIYIINIIDIISFVITNFVFVCYLKMRVIRAIRAIEYYDLLIILALYMTLPRIIKIIVSILYFKLVCLFWIILKILKS